MISTKNTDPALTAALKVITKALKDADEYSSYRLRRVRYNMLRNRGIRSNMTYNRSNPDIEVFSYVRPVSIRHINRLAFGGKGRSLLATLSEC